MTTTRARYGDGSIRLRGTSYELRWRDASGQRSRSLPAEIGEEAALRELRRLTAARDIGTPATIGRRLTVGAWLETWLETRELRPGSLVVYESLVRLYLVPELGRLVLAELTVADVSRAMVRLRKRPSKRAPKDAPGTLSRATVTQAHKLLTHALADALAEGLVGRNVAALVDRPRASDDELGPIVPPSELELRRLLRATATHPYRTAYALAIATGMRQGEVLGLRWQDVDRETGILHVRVALPAGAQHVGPTKTRAGRRDLPIPGVVADALEAETVRGPFVCSTSDGRAIDARNLIRHFHRTCEALGIRPPADAAAASYRWHDLRHAYATVQLAHGRNPSHLAYLMGHASIHELARYGHPQPSIEAAATMDAVLVG